MDYRHELAQGAVLDRKYRIERVIGFGGFGITYSAFDVGLATPVAIKEYYPTQFAKRDSTLSIRPSSEIERPLFERMRSSFLREARTLARFDHPNIVRVLNVFEAHGTAYMVMRLETGPSLKVWRAGLDRRPSEAEVDRIATELLGALEVMHRAEFLHRDIAPDNIIIRDDGSPVLLDFGATRRVAGEASGVMTGIVKRGYSPQEQYSTDSRIQGPWSDIYSLAGTLYYALSGKQPIDSTERMLDDELAPISRSEAGHYPPQFLSAIDWGLQLRPGERPQSVAAWREAMFATDAEHAAVARASTRTSPVVVPPPATRSAPAPASQRRFWVTGAVLAVLVVAGTWMLQAAGIIPSLSLTNSNESRSPSPSDSASTERARAEAEAQRQRDEAARIAAAAEAQHSQQEAQRRANEEAQRIAAEAEARRKAEEADRKAQAATDALAAAAKRTKLIADIRGHLNRVGCTTPALAAGWTDDDQKALQRFVRHAGGTFNFSELNPDIVEAISSYVGRVCPATCAPGETADRDRCTVSAIVPTPARCLQINERAQLGSLSEEDRELLRSGNCRN